MFLSDCYAPSDHLLNKLKGLEAVISAKYAY